MLDNDVLAIPILQALSYREFYLGRHLQAEYLPSFAAHPSSYQRRKLTLPKLRSLTSHLVPSLIPYPALLTSLNPLFYLCPACPGVRVFLHSILCLTIHQP